MVRAGAARPQGTERFPGHPALRGSSGAHPWPWARAGCRCTAPRRSAWTAAPLLGYPLPGRERWGYPLVPRFVPPVPKDSGKQADKQRALAQRRTVAEMPLPCSGRSSAEMGSSVAARGSLLLATARSATICKRRGSRSLPSPPRSPGHVHTLRDPGVPPWSTSHAEPWRCPWQARCSGRRDT